MSRSDMHLADSPDRELFKRIAEDLQQAIGGTWLTQVCGPDQCYWDLAVDGQVITLHLEHYLGIMLLVEKADPQWVTSERFQAVVRRLQMA